MLDSINAALEDDNQPTFASDLWRNGKFLVRKVKLQIIINFLGGRVQHDRHGVSNWSKSRMGYFPLKTKNSNF